MLHELEKELTQVQTTLLKKEMEFEKQQLMTTELEMALREMKQHTCEAECGALQAEVEKLKDFLENTQQQQRMAGEAPASAAHHTPNTWGWSPFLSLNGRPPLLPYSLTLNLPLISSHISAVTSFISSLTFSLEPSPHSRCAVWDCELPAVCSAVQKKILSFLCQGGQGCTLFLCTTFLSIFSRTFVPQFISSFPVFVFSLHLRTFFH